MSGNCTKSSPEEVVSAEESLLVYCKPVHLYTIIHARAQFNPLFLQRNLSYNIRANGETMSSSSGEVFFNYKDCNGIFLKTEVTESCSCPICTLQCASFKSLQLHLTLCHGFFGFEFPPSEEHQTVNVSIQLDAFRTEEGEESKRIRYEPFSFCSKPRKRARSGRNKARKLNLRFLPLDSPVVANDAENGTTLPNNGGTEIHDIHYYVQLYGYRGLGSGYPEVTIGMPGNTPPVIGSSSRDSDAKAALPTEAVVPPTKPRKISAERSEARSNQLLQKRQFYHSHTNQPMSLEEVMSGHDSEHEVDDDVADVEDRQMLDDFVDVTPDEKRCMHLWNKFVRKQRILADGHVPWACQAFARFHKRELVENEKLAWCWRMHLIKLWNYGLIDAVTMDNSNSILEESDDTPDSNNNNNSNNNNISNNSNNNSNNNISNSNNNNSNNNNSNNNISNNISNNSNSNNSNNNISNNSNSNSDISNNNNNKNKKNKNKNKKKNNKKNIGGMDVDKEGK